MRSRGYRRHQQTKKRFGKWWLWLLLLSVALISPAVAQTYRPEVAAASVYQQIPDFPKANQYRLKDRREVDPNNTLVSRLIRYHQDVKKRPTPYRLDWQLTMGDYLGVNEQMLSERYPGAGLLTTSPMEADIQLIRQLSRSQRSQLIDVIVGLYTPKSNIPSPQVNPTPRAPAPTPDVAPVPTQPKPSQPGDADLLKL